MNKHRGSRRHILDWLDSPHFRADLNSLIHTAGATVGEYDSWKPLGAGDKTRETEARLGSWRPKVLPDVEWDNVGRWWLLVQRRANTPNWDFASTCTVDGRKGLVLIEAKAYAAELDFKGKSNSGKTSASIKNHAQIKRAINQAREALNKLGYETGISIDVNYQLSNRIAFAWKLASLGVPVVLVYLGFLGDEGMPKPLRKEEDWSNALSKHSEGIFPEPITDRRIECGSAPFWVLVRTLPIISKSPPASPRRARAGH